MLVFLFPMSYIYSPGFTRLQNTLLSLETISNFLSTENYYYYHLLLPSFFLIVLFCFVLVLLQRYYTRITEDKFMLLLGKNLFYTYCLFCLLVLVDLAAIMKDYGINNRDSYTDSSLNSGDSLVAQW